MDLESLRRDYALGKLSRNELTETPFQLFESWLSQAHNSGALSDPTAMTIATVNKEGQPRQRTVLLKQSDAQGLVFYTNLTSAKAQDLARNTRIAAHFSWLPLERQIAVEGHVELVDRAQVEHYFHSRPRESQLGAWASEQSQSIAARSELEARYEDLQKQYQDKDIPVPEHWGGYRIIPHRFEFWQGGKYRLHDRFEYVRHQPTATTPDNQWTIRRLQP